MMILDLIPIMFYGILTFFANKSIQRNENHLGFYDPLRLLKSLYFSLKVSEDDYLNESLFLKSLHHAFTL